MSEKLLQEHGIKDEYIAIIKEILGDKKLVLNPMQVDFVKGSFLEKEKVVISAPPASGKTLLVHLKYAKIAGNEKKRMIYLVPYIRIQRELLKKISKWKKVGIFSTSAYKTYEEGKAQILVATYASIDYLLLSGKKPTSDFFVFDEVDMITDDLQGTKTESSISRIIRESEVSTSFALSATIGSPELVKNWLDCIPFTSDYRPGDFKKKVKLHSPEKATFEVIEELFQSPDNKEEPMLVFYYNTRRCRQTGVKLSEYRSKRKAKAPIREIALAIKELVGKCDVTAELDDQIRCLNHRVAFYHARLQPESKKIIENLLEKSLLDVVFTTPALARGVNMPARTVVIPSPYKFSSSFGNMPISRAEIEQICGRACRPPFQDKGFGILLTTDKSKFEEFKEKISKPLEKTSSKFLQTSPKKGKTLNRYRLAVEIMKEVRMQKRLEAELSKLFDNYLFAQEIKDEKRFHKLLQEVTSILITEKLITKNIDGELITPAIVDIVIDYGVDDLKKMIRLINLAKDITEDKLELFSGHIFSDILFTLCKNYNSYRIGIINEKYDPEQVKKYLMEKTQIEPAKVGNEHRLFASLVLYSAGNSLEKIEEQLGLASESIPYISGNVVSRDLILLRALIENLCLGDRNKLKLCEYLEMWSNILNRGVPYQVLPFAQLIDRLGRKTALNIQKEYGSAPEILKVLADETSIKKEFMKVTGISSTLSQRILEKRRELIMNLQKKIELWGTFSFSQN
jgi:replicative superfamily II helicase